MSKGKYLLVEITKDTNLGISDTIVPKGTMFEVHGTRWNDQKFCREVIGIGISQRNPRKVIKHLEGSVPYEVCRPIGRIG